MDENIEKILLKYALLNAKKFGKASEDAVIKKVFQERPDLKKEVKSILPLVRDVVERVNLMSSEDIERKIEEMGIEELKREEKVEILPPLIGAEEGKVVMRLAPFPSGPLHIGNARMVILNEYYIRRYKGKLILFFDDTIGSEEKPIDPQAYDLIKDGLEWLGVKYDEVYYKSDRLEIYYEYARKLIEVDKAYVCTCSKEEIRENRRIGVECSCRSRKPKENLILFEKMLKGEFREGEAVVRLKTDMKHPNPAFRDRVLLRISEREHPRVGKRYKVWPMLEFSWAIDDHLIGVTHILRGKELVIEDMMEEFIWDIFGWSKPKFIHYGLLKLDEEGAKLSKSKSRKMIQEGSLKGWDDPRTWSLQSLRKRGIQPQAIRNFILNLGLSEADITVPIEILYAENRKLIDGIANRYFAVLNPVRISLDKSVEKIKIKYHPDHPERGEREIPLDKDEIYVEREDFEKFKGKEVALIGAFTVLLGERSNVLRQEVPYEVPKIHWVSRPFLKIKIIMPNGKEIDGIGEKGLEKLNEGDIVQFYRIGFCRLDNKKDLVFYFSHK
ncbi:MAG: glutamate--tRNA ligase [Candidatus Aenigmarchaeota archaeon]|nr:glutamate--tRNA ligase [Candidatus Aenigmarchaeota archaeon]MCX8190796.1 glutamate--tRNA ligase [Candidatus Aenigmarchaeota archaeon]MDW8160043.1 glutamate--tRNA ligase [Candidatus Aenigmarchaeota archaeon]